MSALRRFVLRLFNVVHPGRAEPDLARELRSHLVLLEDEFRRRGVSEEQARLAARRAFGGVEQTKELHRNARSFAWLDDARRDIRYVVRTLRRSPMFAAVAVATLALGIGANAAVFGVINSVLLSPLPFSEPDRLFLVRGESSTGQLAQYSYPDFVDLREASRSFKRVAAWRGHGAALSGAGEPEFVDARQVSAGLFRVLGVPLALGREFSTDEDRPRGEPVALISHEVWQQRFGLRPDAIGARITIDGKPHAVVGVVPAGFNLFGAPAIYTPLGQYDDVSMQGRRFRPGIWAVGRVQDGLAAANARSELAAISRGLAAQYPPTNAEWHFTPVSLRSAVVGNADRTLFLFAAAAGLVLLIACANVANLFFARAAGRSLEFAIRAAIGATRGRVARQVLTESVIVSLVGGALGLMAGFLSVRLISHDFVGQATALANFSIDSRVALFTMAASVLTAVVFGMPLAFRQEHRAEGLLSQSTRSTLGFRRTQAGLVVIQVALTFVLLAGSGLMLRTVSKLLAVDMGFDPRNVLTAGVGLSPTVTTNALRVRQAWEDILAKAAVIPGVESAALNISLPLQGEESIQYSVTPGAGGQVRSARVGAPTLDYWKTMRIGLVRGRLFDENDTANSPPVAIIDELLAADAFSGVNPIGRTIYLQVGPATIVGVVRHLRYSAPDEDATHALNEQIYVPFTQLPNAFLRPLSVGMRLVLRTSVTPLSLERSLRQAVMGAGLDQPVHHLATMEQIIAGTLAERRIVLRVLMTFAMLALVLASVGVGGVVSYAMSRRLREMGIRIALGAQSADVLKLALAQGLAMIGVGVGGGVVVWLALMQMIARWLYGVTPVDPVTLSAVALALSTTAFLAVYLPARRSLALDPVQVLRCE